MEYKGAVEWCKRVTIDLSLRTVLYVHSLSYRAAGVLATMKEGTGVHPKHRIMDYHKFFKDNITKSDSVLDIGCGDGTLTADISSKARMVVGMDINPDRIKKAKERNMRDNTWYYSGDAESLKLIAIVQREKYDVITMSNVLEHIKNRAQFLSFWGFRGKKLLIRVPMLDRGWLPVYMKELGMDYRLDKDHKTEYTVETLKREIEEANLKLESYTTNYGEIWAIVHQGDEI